ncbi:MAG: FAD-dependent oxidoreductase [Eubacteriales bacterium]|nr:FAD-dependent oxidoreductase [Eubacteriales bacterium]
MNFDVVIIGSGAGLMLVEAALANGLKCALVENSGFGGTCLTKGCIPSKMLVYPADLIREAQSGERVGLTFAPPEIDWQKISDRMWKQINYSDRMEEGLRHTQNLTVFKGTGEFVSPDTMKVRSDSGVYSAEFKGSKFIIAAGARSFVPPMDGLEQAGYLTYESFFGDKYPSEPWKRLVIIGGGAIGAEFTHIFSALGTKVSLVEMNTRLLPTEEEEISAFVKRQFETNGVDVFTGSKAISVSTGENGKTVIVEDTATGSKTDIVCDEIFIASGIRSNSDTMKIENTGVSVDAKGWIITNELLETSVKNIWAIGDINGKYQFRHKANREAEILAHNLFGGHRTKKTMSYASVPWAVFTWPQVAHIGITESEAESRGLHYRTAKNFYSMIAGGIAMGYSRHGGDDGFVKIIAGEDKTILGVHIVGPNAAILLQPFEYLMNAGYKCGASRNFFQKFIAEMQGLKLNCSPAGTYEPISDSMVIHPSLNELTAWVIDKIDWDNGD